ncbi:ATP-binding cassette domain-containing protein, partial [Enterocloster asparagiformis]|uniref:ATP-binding cassette domain-containing protein n=1 Tax=Enterocloster asparagiformis TaxID=333367 RepID=UPI002FE6DD3D
MIEVKDLVKSYGGHMAVDHLSFTVRDGQIYGFLGPNGAGKAGTAKTTEAAMVQIPFT